ncbi:uncharacterized protein LOC122138292 [Tachysurus ichikawai]
MPLLQTEFPSSGRPQRRHNGDMLENPADDASRGKRAGDFIKDNRWIEGPKFLYIPEEDCPENIVHTSVVVDDIEVKKEAFVNVVNTQDAMESTNLLMAYFSDWRRILKRILLTRTRMRRESDAIDVNLAQENLIAKGTTGTQILSAEDLIEAKLAVICYCQQQRFPEEIQELCFLTAVVAPVIQYFLLNVDNIWLRPLWPSR